MLFDVRIVFGIAINDLESLKEMIMTPKQNSLTKFELQEMEEEKEKHRSIQINKGDKFTLKCGHEGQVVWVSSDEKTFSVKGVRRSCKNCGKGASGSWTPTFYLFSRTEV